MFFDTPYCMQSGSINSLKKNTERVSIFKKLPDDDCIPNDLKECELDEWR